MASEVTFETLARQLKQLYQQKKSIELDLNATLFQVARLISAANRGTQLHFKMDDSGVVWTTAELKDASPRAVLDLVCTDGSRVRTECAGVGCSFVIANSHQRRRSRYRMSLTLMSKSNG
jgi:hypothetical protein